MQPIISAALAADRHNDMLRQAALDRRARLARGSQERRHPAFAIGRRVHNWRLSLELDRAVRRASSSVRQEVLDAASASAAADPHATAVVAVPASIGEVSVPCPAVQALARRGDGATRLVAGACC